MDIDPVAVYAAILSTVTAGYGVISNRTRLVCAVSIDWPEAEPVPMSDLGVARGDAYVRIDVTNHGRRPTTVIRGGFVTAFYDDIRPPAPYRIRKFLTRFTRSVAPVPRRVIGHVPLTYGGRRQDQRLDEHETWSASVRAREAAYELHASGRGHQQIVGVYIQLISGRVVYWTPEGARARHAIARLEAWRGGYSDAYPADQADGVAADANPGAGPAAG